VPKISVAYRADPVTADVDTLPSLKPVLTCRN
jgi:hypothetical protein